MILLDTHVWVWWMHDSGRLAEIHRTTIDQSVNAGTGIGISPISCWEVGQLISRGRLTSALSATEWVEAALTHPAVVVLPLTSHIAVASTQLPQLDHHRDPADRFLIATARHHDCPLLTVGRAILAYPHVRAIG